MYLKIPGNANQDRAVSPLNQETLDPFSRVDLACVDISFGVSGDHVQPVESSASVAEEPEVAERPAIGAVNDPDDIVHYIGNINEGLLRPRECQTARGPTIERFGCNSKFPHETSVFGKDLHSIRATISSIGESVI